jgi:hypothetical protein
MKRHLSFVAALGMYFFAPITAAHAQVRADTGSIAIGGSVTGSTINIGVVLCDSAGAIPHGSPERTLAPGQDPKEVARAMLRARASKSNFSRPIKMPPMGIA